MKLSLKTVCYAGGGTVLAALVVLVGIVAFPGLVGGDAAYIVTSGSMSPTIEPGDVIVTTDVSPEEIESGDIVTVHDGSGGDTGYVTHRVVDVVEEDGDRYFQLRGDANDQPDEGLVPAEYVQGNLHLHVPYLGYLLLFARSSLGLFLFVITPGLVLVASGSWQLLQEFGYGPSEGASELEEADESPAMESVDEETLESATDSTDESADDEPETGAITEDGIDTEECE